MPSIPARVSQAKNNQNVVRSRLTVPDYRQKRVNPQEESIKLQRVRGQKGIQIKTWNITTKLASTKKEDTGKMSQITYELAYEGTLMNSKKSGPLKNTKREPWKQGWW